VVLIVVSGREGELNGEAGVELGREILEGWNLIMRHRWTRRGVGD